jgi:REP element-mobilizing transposase RayT
MGRRTNQRQLRFPERGGKRRGAGRKRRGARARVSHKRRPELAKAHPVLVTVRLRDGLPSLRDSATFSLLQQAFEAGRERFGFRLVHFSVQSNHLHLLSETEDKQALARGMQGLLVRVARALNRQWRRTGAVVSDHYHARALRTPREVRNALVYVLQNARKHGSIAKGLDRFSSAGVFEGWTDLRQEVRSSAVSMLARARTWLLATGWKRHGLISTTEKPAPG